MKMMHSAAAAEGRGESPVRCHTLDPEEQQLARKLLDLALELGVEVWGGACVGSEVGVGHGRGQG